VQMRVTVPAASAGFTLSWAQGAGGLGLGGGGDPEPMLVIAHETTDRIYWAYEGAGGSLAVPRDVDGNDIAFDANDDANKATIGATDQNTGLADAVFTKSFDSDPCNERTFIVQLLAPEGGSRVQNVDVENIPTDAQCDTGPPPDDQPPPVCGCRGTDALSLGGLVALLALIRRRRGRRTA
jgi:hypothetical protein